MHDAPYDGLLNAILDLRSAMEFGFARVDERFERLETRVERGFRDVYRRLDGMDDRFDRMEDCFDRMNERFRGVTSSLDDIRERLTVVERR